MADLATTNVGSAVRHRQAAAATAEAGARLVAQSIARSGGDVAAEHEQMVLEAGGTVIRYGFFYRGSLGRSATCGWRGTSSLAVTVRRSVSGQAEAGFSGDSYKSGARSVASALPFYP
jgi:hypothetical protein